VAAWYNSEHAGSSCGTSAESHDLNGVVADDEPEGRLGNDIKHSVADGLGVGAQSTSAFSKDPDDGVEEPGDDSDVHESFEGLQVLQFDSLPESAEEPEDGDEAKHGEAEEDPLFATTHKGADEASNDHEHVSSVHEEALVDRSVGVIDDFPKEEGGRDGPVHIASVVELAAVTAADGVSVTSSHCEVGKRCNEADGTSNDTVKAVLENGWSSSCDDYDGLAGGWVNDLPKGVAEEPHRRKEQQRESNPENNVVVQ